MKKYRLHIVLSILAVVSLGIGALYYDHKKNEELLLSNEIKSEVKKFENYVDDNMGMSGAKAVVLSYDYMVNYSHENEDVEYEFKEEARDMINRALDNLLASGGTPTSFLNEVEHIVEQPYIKHELKESFETQKKEAMEQDEYLASLTKSDIQNIIKNKASYVGVGYTEKQVVEKIGRPYDITTSTSAYDVSKVYEYDNKLVYFKDGVVTRVVDF